MKSWQIILSTVILMCLMIYGLMYLAYLEEERQWQDYSFEFYKDGELITSEIDSRHINFDWYWFRQTDCDSNKFDVVQIYEIKENGSYNFIRENKCTFNWSTNNLIK